MELSREAKIIARSPSKAEVSEMAKKLAAEARRLGTRYVIEYVDITDGTGRTVREVIDARCS